MRPVFISILLSFLSLAVSGQSKIKKDASSIKEMCGCFEVTFEFSETFIYSKDTLYKPSKNKVDKGLEWAQLIIDEKDKISIQHILQVETSSDPYIVKHWRQDWLYENQEFYFYNGDNNWKYIKVPKEEIKGQWTQKVFQVDDSPRYEGSGSWIHIDGKSFWESTTDAPLPRRELSTRNDYNILKRGNRHEIKSFGWVHDQNNKKVLRKTGMDDYTIASEKGYNTYKRVDNKRCEAASNWWKQNKDKWAIVRSQWDEVFSRNQLLSLEKQIDDKPLFMYLFSDEFKDKESIRSIIDSFIIK